MSRRADRRREAAERQARRDKRTAEQQLSLIAIRRGHSRKEMARLKKGAV